MLFQAILLSITLDLDLDLWGHFFPISIYSQLEQPPQISSQRFQIGRLQRGTEINRLQHHGNTKFGDVACKEKKYIKELSNFNKNTFKIFYIFELNSSKRLILFFTGMYADILSRIWSWNWRQVRGHLYVGPFQFNEGGELTGSQEDFIACLTSPTWWMGLQCGCVWNR